MQKINLKKIFNTHGKVDDENGIFSEQLIGLGYRKISDVMIKKMGDSRITPNHVTVIRSIIFLPLMFYLFQRGEYWSNIAGFCCGAVNSLFDILDGQMARARNMYSKTGEWLDDMSDRFSTYLVFSAIIIGSFKITQNTNLLIAGVFVLFFHGMIVIISEKFGTIYGGYEAFFGLRIKEAILNNKKATIADKIFLNLYGFYSWPSYFLFAVRYQVLVGIIFNILPYMIYYWFFAFAFRAVFLFLLYIFIVKDEGTNNLFIHEMRKVYKEKTALSGTSL